jgi:hypothetical protein
MCAHNCSGRISYQDMYEMMKNIQPPLGFGNKCPYKVAYKVHICRKVNNDMFIAASNTNEHTGR